MQRTLNQLLKDAVERRLSFDTTYSHDNIYDWLQTILTDWTIIIPGQALPIRHLLPVVQYCDSSFRECRIAVGFVMHGVTTILLACDDQVALP